MWSTLHWEDDISASRAGVISSDALIQSTIIDRHRSQLQRPGPLHRVPPTTRLQLHAVLQPRDVRSRLTNRVAREQDTWPDGRRHFRLVVVFDRRRRFARTPLSSVHTSNNVQATLSNVTSRTILFTKSNVASISLPFLSKGLNFVRHCCKKRQQYRSNVRLRRKDEILR